MCAPRETSQAFVKTGHDEPKRHTQKTVLKRKGRQVDEKGKE